ncbi:uncharacterized protein LOC130688472 [Daphnia carinata]|uniref:uncharacterized protein LOC130688472 n=1 Tax=Daphnia carinata TaxID=120202 RepID=UPI00257A68D9|nr:uncharacterized protein LOC130688472 [Daphnia carinata]
MENEELDCQMLMESRIIFKDVTIELSPLHQNVNEEVVHESFFQWATDDGQAPFSNFLKQNTSVTFVSSRPYDSRVHLVWTNPMPIDLSGLPGLYRILVIRDITQRLRLLDEQNDEDNKMLTGSGETTINFKLEDIEFSLLLVPTNNQPGNALLTMQRNAGEPYGERHGEVEEFNCFEKLDAKEIDSVVSNARRTGKQITDRDINNSEEDEIKKKMAEEMNFFMLLYDFEVARRLQRPFVHYSHVFDSLPIGIGIAMIHRINSRTVNQRWIFFSGLFLGNGESRKRVLDDIVMAFKGWNEQRRCWTELDLINILREQFGSRKMFR